MMEDIQKLTNQHFWFPHVNGFLVSGTEMEAVFRSDTDRNHLLGRLAEILEGAEAGVLFRSSGKIAPH